MVDLLQRTSTAAVAVGVAVPVEQGQPAARFDLPVAPFDNDLNTIDPPAIMAVLRSVGADAVLMTPGRGVDNEVLRRIARACEWRGIPLYLAPAVFDVASSATVHAVSGLPILAMSRPGPVGTGRLAKVILDRLGAAAGLVLLGPLMFVVGVSVRLDSRGPALFRQTRVGAQGCLFTMVKFRTMHLGAEDLVPELTHLNESDGTTFKIRADPRVTRLGRFLRTTSIDELPQLFNVLAGQMSLVGPRPPLSREVAMYTPAERRRLIVKPGMTGLWQVGGRSNLSWADTVRLDLSYVESWSLPLDLCILGKTLPAVIRRHGAF